MSRFLCVTALAKLCMLSLLIIMGCFDDTCRRCDGAPLPDKFRSEVIAVPAGDVLFMRFDHQRQATYIIASGGRAWFAIGSEKELLEHYEAALREKVLFRFSLVPVWSVL